MMAVQVADERVDPTRPSFDEILADEQAGVPLPLPPRDRGRRSHVILDKRPLSLLIESRIELRAREGYEDPQARVARELGVATKRIPSYLEGITIDENIAEQIVYALGLMPGDLWPEGPESKYREALEEGRGSPVIPRRYRRSGCASPGCENLRSASSLWCDAHGEFFAQIRIELKRETKARHKRSRRAGARPTCSAPGCIAPRTPPASFCVSCALELDVVEEERDEWRG